MTEIQAHEVEPSFEQKLEILKGWYEALGNPLYVWEALGECIAASAPLPPWAKEYFARACAKFSDREIDPGDGARDFVFAALELKTAAGRNRFKERKQWENDNIARAQAIATAQRKARNPNDQAEVIRLYKQELQDLGVSVETMDRKVRRVFPDKT